MGTECPTCRFPLDDAVVRAGGARTADALTAVGDATAAACPNCGADLQRTGATESFSLATAGAAPTRVAHFALIDLLGQGSFGSVWLAEDLHLGRQVALKLPVAHHGDAASLVHEAKTAAQLRHPNIVAIYEVGRTEGQVFIASEYIAGMDLRDFLSQGQLSFQRTVTLVREIALALHHAHEHGIVHCDVKPANILIGHDGRPYVADFGLARHLAVEVPESSDGRVFGTADYMSPEQASGRVRETDRRADLYALGVMLFEMFTGERPYRGTRRAVLQQKVAEDAPSPRKLQPQLPRDLETICLKCLEREPQKRYATALEVAEELDRFTRGEPIRARPVSALEHGWRWCRRRPAVAGLWAGLLGSLTFGLISVCFLWLEANARSDQTRRSLYRSQMNLLDTYLSRGDVAAARHSLAQFLQPDLCDLRAFEWFYYQAEIAPFRQATSHGDVVRDVAVSRDADWFASAGFDRTIRIWDSRSGKLLRQRDLEVGRWEAIAVSPTDNRLVAGSSDGMLRVWPSMADDHPHPVIKHGPPVSRVRISPDGRMLASAGKTGAVRLWEMTTGDRLQDYPAGPTGIADIQFTPDSRRLVVASNDGQIRCWDCANRHVMLQWQTPLRVESIALSDDGSLVAVGGYNGKVEFYSAADGLLQYEIATLLGKIGDLQFLPQSAVLAIPTITGHLVFHDTRIRREVRSMRTHAAGECVVAPSANGRFLVFGSGDGSVKLLDIKKVHLPTVLWLDQHVRDVKFLPGGQQVLVAGGNGDLKLMQVDGSQTTPLLPGDDEVSAVDVQHAGDLIAAGTADGLLSLWDWRRQEPVDQFEVPTSGITVLEFSASDAWLAVAGHAGSVCVLNCVDWQAAVWPTATASKATVIAIAFAPDEATMAVAYDDGNVQLLHTRTGQAAASHIRIPTAPTCLTFCDGGRVLAVGTAAGDVHRWDLAAAQQRSVIKAHSGGVFDLIAFPDSDALVTGGRDGELRIWDIPTGELRATLAGHRRRVFCLDTTSDGRTIASGGLEGDIRFWSGQL